MSNSHRNRAGGTGSSDLPKWYLKRVQQLEALKTGELTEVPAWLERIAAADRQHTIDTIASRVIFPDPEQFDTIDEELLAAHGFSGKISAADLESRFGIDAKTALGKDFDLIDFLRRARGRSQGRARSGKGKGRGGKQLPKPSDVDQVVTSYLKGLADVSNEGNIRLGEFNAEFLDATKAKTFLTTYEKMVKKFHVLFVEETEFYGLREVGQKAGYGYKASKANTRNQAVGFLVHPRLEILKVDVCDAVANVKGVPDLRPAYLLELKDRTSGVVFSVVVVHLKSMRGGPAVTGPIRYQQCKELAKWLGSGFCGVVAGDFNCFLNNTKDTDPLIQAGFKLVYPHDTQSTQSMGGRLDGFFHMGLPHKIGVYQVRSIWKNQVFGRGFSDHSLLKTDLRLCGVKGASDNTCGVGDSATGPYGDGSSETSEVTP